MLPRLCCLKSFAVLQRYYEQDFGNPSSVHRYGRAVRVVVDDARDQVAHLLGAPASSIFFSSGGTEANNTILKGVAAAHRERGRHLVTSAIEHPCVLDTCTYLAQQGYTITHVPVGSDGVIDPAAVRAADETILVSIMHANNRVGTLQPIAEIASIVREHGALMHTDAVQSFGKLPYVSRPSAWIFSPFLGINSMPPSSKRVCAPRGVPPPLIHGGHQARHAVGNRKRRG